MYRDIYKKLLKLYPPSFLERFGESMEQTFDDLYREQETNGKLLPVRFLIWSLTETAAGALKENFMSFTPGNAFRNLTGPRIALTISFILSLPIGLFLAIFFSNIEWLQAPVKYMLSVDGQQINTLGRIFTGGGILLLPFAFVIDLIPVVRTAWNERKIAAHPVNLMLGGVIFLLIYLTWGVLLIDLVRCQMSGYCD